MDNHDHASAPKRKRGRKTKPPPSVGPDNGNYDSDSGPKPKRGRKPKPPAAASPDNHHPSSPLAAAADSPDPASSPAPRGRGRKPRRGRHEPPSDADAAPRAPPSPPRRGASKGVANIKAEIPAVEPLRWEQVAKAMPSMDAVVKVFCVHTEPNFSLPWQRKRQYSSSSSGFIIGGRRVLTNAHSVEHYTQVKLKKRGSDTKYLATVLALGTECDIAMLTVEDDEFWKGVSPVEFGSLPALQDAVTVVGYPIGGDTISVTSGVVSRIEILSYVHGSTEIIGLQIDAAINSGNSGGPALNDKGKCVGIAFQSLKHEDVENIGYVIPTPVIKHFIQDYEKSGEYTGFPILGIEWQKMENPDLRKAMGMKSDQKGVRVRRVEPTAPESGCLQPSDIILSFDGIDIANDGTVPFRHGERIGFSYLVSQKYTGEKAHVKVLRNSKVHEFNIKLATHKRLIPAHIKGRPPSYYIVAGFVFMAVSVPYFQSEYGKDYGYDPPVKLLDKLMHAMAQSPDEQLVVVSQVLVADINIGYEEIVNTQVLAFNGKPVKNLKHLATMVEDCNEEFLKFDLEYDQVVVLETKTAKAATQDFLTTHCIPSAMSDDLKSRSCKTNTMDKADGADGAAHVNLEDDEGEGDEPQGEEGTTEPKKSVHVDKGKKRVGHGSPSGKRPKKTYKDVQLKRLVDIWERSHGSKNSATSVPGPVVDPVRQEISEMIDLVFEAGAEEGSDEHFYATQLLIKKEYRDVFHTLKTHQGRLTWLTRTWEEKKRR